MCEKKVKYEIVEVNKTEDESEIDKAITEFKEVCRVYNIALGEEPKIVKEITKKLIESIKVHKSTLRTYLRKYLDTIKY